MTQIEPKNNHHLTSGHLLARNTLWNLFGQILPMLAGVLTIPIIVRSMGVERFGVLSLAWVVVGYFSLFDLGIGRALTKFVADKLGSNEEHLIPSLAWTSLLLMFILGGAGSVLTFIFSPLLVHKLLKIPLDLQPETLRAFYLLALSIPIVTTTAGLRGILEAFQRFRIVNLIKTPMSIFSFVAPLLVLPFSTSLVPVVGVLVASRLLGCLIHLWATSRVLPALLRNRALDRSAIGPLAGFGGWITVNNIIGPLMFYLDRFTAGSLVSISAVAYYTAPVDMMLRLAVIPGAIVGVLFPAFATSLSQNRERSGMLLTRGLKYIFLVMFPIVLILVTFAPEGLNLWLGPAFSARGAVVLRLAAAGIFVNALSTLPFSLIQSAGRPDITAYVLMAELPPYLAALWFLTRHFGIEGTAMAWAGRLLVELAVVFGFSHRFLPTTPKWLLRNSGVTAGALAILYGTTLPKLFGIKLAVDFVLLVAFVFVAWSWGLSPSERDFFTKIRANAPAAVRAV
jgi:O-antigen/teichoic acid export membrane protein